MAVITLSEDSVPLIETEDETLLLRIRATMQYTTYEGVTILVGDGIYLEYSCPVTNHVAAVPVTTVYSTTDNISNLDPRWTAEFWDSTGSQFIAPYYANYQIPATPTTTTKAALDILNAAAARVMINSYYNAPQVDAKIEAAITGDNAAPMNTTRLGTAKLSRPATDVTAPIVVGDNDERVGGVAGSSTKAGLPSASTAGRLYRVTDNTRGIWNATGTQWRKTTRNINVQDWGAKGDGSTDDTAAIRAAIAVATARSGGRIFLPDTGSHYIITDEIVPTSGVTICGEASGANSGCSQLRLTASNKNAIKIGQDIRDVCIEDLEIKATSLTGTTAIKLTGAAANSSQRFLFRNLNITSFNRGLYVLATDVDMAWQCSYMDADHVSITDGNICIHLNTLNCELNFKDGQLGSLQDGFGCYIDRCGSLRLSEDYPLGPAGAGAICVLGVPNPAFADTFLYVNGPHGDIELDHCLAENYRYYCQQKFEDYSRPIVNINCDASALVDLATDTTWVSLASTYATDNFTAAGDTRIYSLGDTFKAVDKCGNATGAKGSFICTSPAKVVVQSTFLGTEYQLPVHIGTDTSTTDPEALTTPLLEIGDANVDKVLLALGQVNGSRVLSNHFKWSRNSLGELVITATQAIPNNGLKMNMPFSISGTSSASLSSSGFAKFNYDVGANLLQFSTNGSAYMNVINAATVLTPNAVVRAIANGEVGNGSMVDDGVTISHTIPLSINGGTNLTTTNCTGTGNLVKSVSPTITSPTMTAPVLGVATGTSLALGGGTALTTTNASGTGNLVKQTSPTLITPALGVATGTSLALGSGTAITKIARGTVTIDPASISANTVAVQTFTLAGVAVHDTLILNIPAAGLTAGLLVHQVWVSATDTIKISFQNTTGGSIDEASASWDYTLIRS